MTDSEYWGRYYEVTVERPAWITVRRAIELFGEGGGGPPRFAVDLGCGAGRDARELLNAGWRVLAIDREPGAISALEAATAPDVLARLESQVEDLADVAIPACDLVNASLCLPFLTPESFARTWQRILDALPIGGRFAAMLFGDHDGSANDPEMTCLPPDEVRSRLAAFEIEYWTDREEDTTTALGEPHHFHLVEFVARRVATD